MIAGRELGIHGAADRPERAGLALDPDEDSLGGAGIVHPVDEPLSEDARRCSAHRSG
jgi:hypothetical protein